MCVSFLMVYLFMCVKSMLSNSQEQLNTRDQRETLLRGSFSNTKRMWFYGMIKATGFGRVPEIFNQLTIGGRGERYVLR